MATQHYGIPEANRNSGFLTSDWNAALQKIDAEMWKIPQYRANLTSSGDVNNLSGSGLWYIQGSVPTNAPSGITWSMLFQFVVGSVTQQYIIKPVTRELYFREYSGSPASWSNWQPVSGYTAPVRINYGSNSYVEYWRNGQTGVLKMYYNVADGSIDAWNTKTIATLPEGFRPAQSILMRGIVDRMADDGTCFVIENSGAVKISTRTNPFNRSGDVLQGTLTYPIRY